MFGNALMEVSGRITDIICIAQITCKFINNALPIYNTRLNFFRLKILFQFFAHKNWLQSDANLSFVISAERFASLCSQFFNELLFFLY